MAEKNNVLIESIKDTVKENSRLLTVFAVSAIIIAGITLVEYPQNWWIALAAVVGFFLVIFIFLNARVVIKTTITFVLTVILAGVAFNLGAASEPYGAGAFIWLFGHFVVLFLSLAISYLIPSGQSRWTSLSFAVVLYFGLTWTLTVLTKELSLSAGISILLGVGAFVLIFIFGNQTRFSSKHMPQPISTPELTENILHAAELSGFFSSPMASKDDTSFVVWKDRSYILYPVLLEQAFGVMGRKNSLRLSYKAKSINSWLRYLSFTKNPHFTSRGADSMLVLLDMNNANGKEFKVIGVSLPDSRAVTPVGIMPGKLLLAREEKALQKALAHFDSFYEDYVTDLTEKQKEAFSKFGVEKKSKKTPSEIDES